MKVIADICIVPVGVGVSLSEYIAACEQVLEQSGLQPNLHAFGTNVEGDWDAVMAALKHCHQRVHEMGAPRISTTIRLGTRTDKEQGIQDRIDSVRSKTGNP